jgi:hypothetical protein
MLFEHKSTVKLSFNTDSEHAPSRSCLPILHLLVPGASAHFHHCRVDH